MADHEGLSPEVMERIYEEAEAPYLSAGYVHSSSLHAAVDAAIGAFRALDPEVVAEALGWEKVDANECTWCEGFGDCPICEGEGGCGGCDSSGACMSCKGTGEPRVPLFAPLREERDD